MVLDDSLRPAVQEPVLDFLSNCGVSVRIAANLVDNTQPRAQPSENVIGTIKSLVESER